MIEKIQMAQKEAAEGPTPDVIEHIAETNLNDEAEGNYAEQGADNQVGSVSVDRGSED